MDDYGLRTQSQVTPKFHVQHGNFDVKFLRQWKETEVERDQHLTSADQNVFISTHSERQPLS